MKKKLTALFCAAALLLALPLHALASNDGPRELTAIPAGSDPYTTLAANVESSFTVTIPAAVVEVDYKATTFTIGTLGAVGEHLNSIKVQVSANPFYGPKQVGIDYTLSASDGQTTIDDETLRRGGLEFTADPDTADIAAHSYTLTGTFADDIWLQAPAGEYSASIYFYITVDEIS